MSRNWTHHPKTSAPVLLQFKKLSVTAAAPIPSKAHQGRPYRSVLANTFNANPSSAIACRVRLLIYTLVLPTLHTQMSTTALRMSGRIGMPAPRMARTKGEEFAFVPLRREGLEYGTTKVRKVIVRT